MSRMPLPNSNGEHHGNNDELISPQSWVLSESNWRGSSSISNDLDSFRSRPPVWQPQTSSRSVKLFHQLPPEVIRRVLWATDANGFASLCLLNSAWYHESQSLELYAYHLSRCPSYALSNNVITGPFRKNDLLRLKSRFAVEVRRNLFDAYLRPRETHVNLISTCANSSAAFPASEAFRFEFSPNGRRVLAVSSSRIYVLDSTTESVTVTRELKTVRRSISASITDDGSLLAVLSSKYQANVYGLVPGDPVKHLQVIILDNPPRTIALAHEGTVLAAAYEGAIEVFSLSHMALVTDRRSVRCEAVDSLMFSGDGSMIVGSSNNLQEPNAVVVTAPFYTENDPNITPQEIHSRMWTTQILFPQISSTVSHAALLSGHGEGDAYWLFAYDHTLMTYRAVRTDDTRTGVAYFLSPPGEERFDDLTPEVPPSVTACGTLAVAGFDRGGLFLYGVPERLDISPDMGAVIEREEERNHGRLPLTTATGHLTHPLMAYSPSVSAEGETIDEDGLAGKVDWRQSLFVKSRPIRSIQGCNAARWVERVEDGHCGFKGKRLLVTAPAGVNRFGEDLGDEDMPVDGSRLCLLDFDYGPATMGHSEVTIEVGDNEAELLIERSGNMEIEVAMERRRTVRRNRTHRGTVVTQLGRAQTSASSPVSPRENHVHMPVSPDIGPGSHMLSAMQVPITRAQSTAGYHQARFPPRPPLGSSAFTNDHNQYAQPNGPHRGSQGSWETPPPPYIGDNMSSFHAVHSPMPVVPQVLTQPLPARPATVNGEIPQSSSSSIPAAFRQHQAPDLRSGTDASQTYRGFAQLRSRSPLPGGIPEESEPPTRHNTRAFQTNPSDSRMVPPITATNTHFAPENTSVPGDVSAGESTLGLRPNMMQPPSLPTPEGHGYMPGQDAIQAAPVARNEQHRLSLTGANLQNRLNHPTPPTPVDTPPQNLPHGTTGPVETVHEQQLYVPLIQTQHQATSFYQNAPASPSAEQLDRLNRRSSQGRTAAATNYSLRSDSRDFASRVGSTPPPRGAWGAAGVAGTAPFTRAIMTPDGTGLSRSGSRGGQRHIPNYSHSYVAQASHSTPNLLTPGAHGRPNYRRLDTIESVNSVYPLEGAARSRSFDGGQMPSTGLMNPHYEQPGMPLGMLNGNSDSTTDANIFGESKKAKKMRKKYEKSLGNESKEKKGFRCVVM